MKLRGRRPANIAAGILLLGVVNLPSSWAHHSFAIFDTTRPLSVRGTVHSFEWRNPHVWLWVRVTGETGSAVYAFEGSSIGEMMRRNGWTKTAVRPGDHITVQFLPFKDGKNGGRLTAVTLPDGRTIGG